jgi:hypothetical protein
MSADNQQERLKFSYWIVGFTDGEGCFHIQINENSKLRLGYQVLPEFRLTQHNRDKELLLKIRDFLNLGVVRKNSETVSELRIRKHSELSSLCNFFTNYPLQTKKKKDFEKFKKVIDLLKKDLTSIELKEIIKIKKTMNKKQLQNPQRPNARR